MDALKEASKEKIQQVKIKSVIHTYFTKIYFLFRHLSSCPVPRYDNFWEEEQDQWMW